MQHKGFSNWDDVWTSMNMNKLAMALGIIATVLSIIYVVMKIMQDQRCAQSREM